VTFAYPGLSQGVRRRRHHGPANPGSGRHADVQI